MPMRNLWLLTRSHLEKQILVQYQGGPRFLSAGIRHNIEHLKRGPNTEIEPKGLFKMASNARHQPDGVYWLRTTSD